MSVKTLAGALGMGVKSMALLGYWGCSIKARWTSLREYRYRAFLDSVHESHMKREEPSTKQSKQYKGNPAATFILLY